MKQRDLAFFTKKSLQKKVRKLEAGIAMRSSELRNKINQQQGACAF